MKYFGFSIDQWKAVKRIDKIILRYWRVMEHFYNDMAETAARQRVDAKAQASKFMNRKRTGR